MIQLVFSRMQGHVWKPQYLPGGTVYWVKVQKHQFCIVQNEHTENTIHCTLYRGSPWNLETWVNCRNWVQVWKHPFCLEWTMLRVLCTIASVCASIFFGHLLYVFSTVSVCVCHTLCVLCHCVCFVQVAYLCLCWTSRWPAGKNLNAVCKLRRI